MPMLLRRARPADVAVEIAGKAVPPQPEAPGIPGLAEAQADLLVAQKNVDDLTRRIRRQQADWDAADLELAQMASRVKNGGEVEPQAMAALEAAKSVAEAQVRGLQDALTSADGDMKRARDKAARAKREEIGRRAKLAASASAAADDDRKEAEARRDSYGASANNWRLASVNSHLTSEDCDVVLAQSAEFAARAGGSSKPTVAG